MKTTVVNFRFFCIFFILAFLLFSINVGAQSDTGDGRSFPLFVVFLLPFIVLALFGIIWAIVYPIMFLWGAVSSSKNVERMHEDANRRKMSLRQRRGREILNTIDGGLSLIHI